MNVQTCFSRRPFCPWELSPHCAESHTHSSPGFTSQIPPPDPGSTPGAAREAGKVHQGTSGLHT